MQKHRANTFDITVKQYQIKYAKAMYTEDISHRQVVSITSMIRKGEFKWCRHDKSDTRH